MHNIFIVKIVVQVLSQPCGWMICAPRWSQAERTDRPSSGSSSVKQVFLHAEHSAGADQDFQCNILDNTGQVSCRLHDPDFIQRSVAAQYDRAVRAGRGLKLSLNCCKQKVLTVVLVHIYLHIERKLSNCSFVHESRKLKTVFTPYFSLLFSASAFTFYICVDLFFLSMCFFFSLMYHVTLLFN